MPYQRDRARRIALFALHVRNLTDDLSRASVVSLAGIAPVGPCAASEAPALRFSQSPMHPIFRAGATCIVVSLPAAALACASCGCTLSSAWDSQEYYAD